ncbi:MAG: hypothetical protein ABIP11_05390 [Luteimonas sp.]
MAAYLRRLPAKLLRVPSNEWKHAKPLIWKRLLDAFPGRQSSFLTRWWWMQSCANPSLVFEFPFTGKRTANFVNLKALLSAISPCKPAVMPFLQPYPTYGTGNANREILDYNRD